MNPLGPPVWAAELAGRFWHAVGPPPPFPRHLEPLAAYFGLLLVIPRPNLSVASVREHLHAQRVPAVGFTQNRPLRAALYCWRGFGWVYLDADDPPAERRFSMAHELAHFLRDCEQPRRRAERTHGPAALAVLDGLRPPTETERLHAALRNRPLTAFAHFLSRDSVGRPDGEAERRAEADADRLAFELLAPADCFRDCDDEPAAVARLVNDFGLPVGPALQYARLLFPPPPPLPAYLAHLAKPS